MTDPFPYGTETWLTPSPFLAPAVTATQQEILDQFSRDLAALPRVLPVPHPMDDATGRAAALVGTVLVIAAGLLVGGGLTAVTIWWRNR